jgi:class 3 adenylate cyclase
MNRIGPCAPTELADCTLPNFLSRIAYVAGPGEVLASRAVVGAVDDPSLRFERVDERPFKGISEPVTLFRVSRDGR